MWFDVSQKNCRRQWRLSRLLVVMKLPVTRCPWLWPSESWNSFHEGMFKLNAKFDADSLLYLLTHFECNSHTVHRLTQQVYHPHWLVQWSHHCSPTYIPVYTPWLPIYIKVAQTVLVILTMVVLFRGRYIDMWLSVFFHDASFKPYIHPTKCRETTWFEQLTFT